MSSKSDALKAIARIADVEVSQLPSMSPRDFSASEWQYVLEYSSAVDIRESLMQVYRNAGANTVCPNPTCRRYAKGVFFQRGSKLPRVFRCEYENIVWYDRDADMTLVDMVLRKYNAKLWYEQ